MRARRGLMQRRKEEPQRAKNAERKLQGSGGAKSGEKSKWMQVDVRGWGQRNHGTTGSKDRVRESRGKRVGKAREELGVGGGGFTRHTDTTRMYTGEY